MWDLIVLVQNQPFVYFLYPYAVEAQIVFILF